MKDAPFCLFLTLPRSLLHHFTKKKKITESVHPSWVDSSAANQLLAYCLCHQAWILRKAPLFHRCRSFCVRICACVCVWAETLMKWNARIGRSLWGTSPSSNVRQPAAQWDQGKAASIRACRRTRSDPTGENILTEKKKYFSAVEGKDCHHPHPHLFYSFSFALSLSGAPSFFSHFHFDFSPHSSRVARWNIKPPCMTICTCMDLKTRRWWVFECVIMHLCSLCALLEVASLRHTHTHAQ